uniref:Tyrosine--tRNA ligase n=1 Tax=Candidatus Caldatribacterium saccharofermentans TaxID=1454753 RepID=A0A7V4TG26_9BACT
MTQYVEQVERDLAILKRGTEEIIDLEDLRRKLLRFYETGKKLVVKEGFDPSAPDIHLGHTVTLRKLRQFQELGHEVVFLIGDFTGRIGDPTGKKETRRQLTEEEVQRNARTYAEQVFKVLDPEKTRIAFNSTWLSRLTLEEVIVLASRFTVARMLEREDFSRRLREGRPIGLHEFLYPLLQGYDSVALQADVELGGTDQRFNLLVGRDLQREFGQEPQVIITMPLLEGTDGVEKMSKSLGNYIGINEPPFSMFGKVMSIPDFLIEKYFVLLTDVPLEEVRKKKEACERGELHPKVWKEELAFELVRLYHGEEEARKALEDFERAFSQKACPESAQDLCIAQSELVAGKLWIMKLLQRTGVFQSKSEARRCLEQGGVYLNGERISGVDQDVPLKDGDVLRVGKKSFFRIRIVASREAKTSGKEEAR